MTKTKELIVFQNGVQVVQDEMAMREYASSLNDSDNADISKKELLMLLDRITELRQVLLDAQNVINNMKQDHIFNCDVCGSEIRISHVYKRAKE